MLKLGYNEATCKENSTVERDLALCEKYGYDSIELRLDMLKDYLHTNTVEDLKAFFAKSHLKPFAFNAIENINFCNEQEWKELVELFTFGCEIAQQIGNPYIIVVPTVTPEICTKNEKEVFDDSVKVLNQLADIAEPYGVKLSFESTASMCICRTSAQMSSTSKRFRRTSCLCSTSMTVRICRSAFSTIAIV